MHTYTVWVLVFPHLEANWIRKNEILTRILTTSRNNTAPHPPPPSLLTYSTVYSFKHISFFTRAPVTLVHIDKHNVLSFTCLLMYEANLPKPVMFERPRGDFPTPHHGWCGLWMAMSITAWIGLNIHEDASFAFVPSFNRSSPLIKALTNDSVFHWIGKSETNWQI